MPVRAVSGEQDPAPRLERVARAIAHQWELGKISPLEFDNMAQRSRDLAERQAAQAIAAVPNPCSLPEVLTALREYREAKEACLSAPGVPSDMLTTRYSQAWRTILGILA